MTINYKNSLVCFIDLLGFKDEIDSGGDPSLIHDVLHGAKINESNEASVKVEKIGQETRFQVFTKVTTFSDCIVMSFSDGDFDHSLLADWVKSAFIQFWDSICQFSMYAMRRGFVLRGGLTIGDVFHDRGIIFGPAMNRAYELESKSAKYPRIAISDLLLSKLNEDTKQKYLKQDLSDGIFYIDFLKSLVDENINPATGDYCGNSECISKLITKNILLLSQKKENANKLQKWKWFSNYYHDCCQAAGFKCRCDFECGKYEI